MKGEIQKALTVGLLILSIYKNNSVTSSRIVHIQQVSAFNSALTQLAELKAEPLWWMDCSQSAVRYFNRRSSRT